MREIKFKAWDKNLKEIIPVHNIDFQNKMVNVNSVCRLFDEVELMQFTGFHDKNNREIYDGDIVTNKTKDFSGNGFRGKNLIMSVKWDQKECFYRLSVCNKGYFGFKKLTTSTSKDIEVVGNIYVNSDLLQ